MSLGLFTRYGLFQVVAGGGGGGPDETEHYVTLTIQASEVDATLTSFPVFVGLSDLPAGFWTAVQANGGDIRVTEDDGTTRVPVELVDIDTTGETGELHFLASSLSAVSNTIFRIYYGKTGGGLSQPAVTGTYGRNAVWADYAAVWHFEGDPSGTAPQILDSTGNAHNGTTYGSMTSGDSVAGKLEGQAVELDGSNDYIVVPDSADLEASSTGQFIVQTWVRVATASGDAAQVIADKTAFSGSNGQYELYYDNRSAQGSPDEFRAFWGVSSGDNVTAGGSPVADATWYLLHIEYDYNAGSEEARMYVNGVLTETVTPTFDIKANALNLVIGTINNASQRFLGGRIDEMRIGPINRTADHIIAEHTNQHTPTTFYAVGSQQTA